MLFAINNLVLFENSDENNFSMKDRGTGRKRLQNVEFHNLYCLSGTRVSKNSGKMGKKCGMDGSEGNIE